jgi:hypothetical protein
MIVDQLRRGVAMPYTPGVSQADLQRKAQAGVAVPTTATQALKGAAPEHALPAIMAAEEGIAGANIDRELALQQQLDDRLAAIERNQLAMRAQQADAVRAVQEQEARLGAVQAKRDEYVSRLNAITDDLGTAKINPNRVWEDMGTGGRILAAIAMGIGAIGAGEGGTNYAMQLIQARIDRDIEAQKAALSTKEGQQSMLGQLVDRFDGDVESAATALKMLQTKQAETMAADAIAASGRADAITQWQLGKAERDRASAERYSQLMRQLAGTADATTSSTIEYPRAPSGGGRRPMTLEELAKMREAGARFVESGRKMRGELSPQEAAKLNAGGETAAAQLQSKREKTDRAQTALEQHFSAAGVRVGPPTPEHPFGTIEVPTGDIAGAGLWDSRTGVAGGGGFTRNRKASATANGVYSAFAAMRTNSEPSTDAVAQVRENIPLSDTKEAVSLDALQRAWDEVQSAQANFATAESPAARAAAERNARDERARQAKEPAAR